MRTFRLLVSYVALCFLVLNTSQSQTNRADKTLPWVTNKSNATSVVYRTFDSRTVGARVSYHVYIPEAYSRTGKRLPVLYWLHGTEGGISGIRPVAQFFDEGIRAGKIPAMMVVFVNGLPRRLWADSKDGVSPVETVFIFEVIPDVDQNFHTIASREGRILEGFSMGGYGAARLGFKYPSLFSGISILAGGPLDLDFDGPRAQRNPSIREQLIRDVCSNDLNYFKAISPWMIAETATEALQANHTIVRQAVGLRDNTRDLNYQFHERMMKLNITHKYFEFPQVDHDSLAVLEHLINENSTFYWQALELTNPDQK